MDADEWTAAYTAHLIKQGRGETTARLLASATAGMHAQLRGPDPVANEWPAPEAEFSFETRDDSDTLPDRKP